MTWPFENDTRGIEKKMARTSFQANRVRNIIAVISIILTAILFTGLFTLQRGLTESTERADMILSGGDGHARIIGLSQSQYDVLSAHPLIHEIAYCRTLAESVDNEELSKRETLFLYYDDIALKYNFIEPTSGHRPEAENEIIADTQTLELLNVPLSVGESITLELTVQGRQIKRDFVLAGWWESYPGVHYGTIAASQSYMHSHAEEIPYQQGAETGSITAIIKFADTHDIREQLKTVVEESGFSTNADDGNYVNAGINPKYSSVNQTNAIGTNFAIACALFMFLLVGYLIIYNIFQISVLRDIHFWGLLKTIGASERQIRAMIRRQTLRLSVIGIPVGLLAGYWIGKVLLPILMKASAFSDYDAIVSPNPLIFIAAALFTFLTVWISTRKSEKTAAKVSPIEAVRYTDTDPVFEKRKKRRNHAGNICRAMAWANLGRNKKRTALVVLSLSLSMVLTNTVFTLSNSVNPEKAIENLIGADFCVGHNNLLNYIEINENSAISGSIVESIRSQPGFENGGYEYGCRASYKSDTTQQIGNQQEDGSFATHIYGLEHTLLSWTKLVDGEVDAEKLASGQYILEGAYVNSRGDMDVSSINHAVGDTVQLYCNGAVQEFTVLGHIVANEGNTYDWVGSCFFLPSDIYQSFTGNDYAMTYLFNVYDGYENQMNRFLAQYVSEAESEMTFRSKDTIMAGVSDIQNIIFSVGGAMAFLIGMIGLLNFSNTILTSLFSRRQEFALIQSVGMTGRQLRRLLCMESCWYIVLSAVIAIPLSFVTATAFVRPICDMIWFLSYRANFYPVTRMTIILLFIGIFIPCVIHKLISRESVVERLKRGE